MKKIPIKTEIFDYLTEMRDYYGYKHYSKTVEQIIREKEELDSVNQATNGK